jgi:hypothetical protein
MPTSAYFDYLYPLKFLCTSSFALFLLFAFFIVFKIVIARYIAHREQHIIRQHVNTFYLLIMIGTWLPRDLSCIMQVLRSLHSIDSNLLHQLLSHISWVGIPVFYHTLSLFLDELIADKSRNNSLQQATTTYSILLFGALTLCIACMCVKNVAWKNVFLMIEGLIACCAILYVLFLLVVPSMVRCVQKMYSSTLPRTLEHQLTQLLGGMVVPLWLLESGHIMLSVVPRPLFSNNPIVLLISNIFLTGGIYYSCFKLTDYSRRKIIGLQLLTTNEPVYERSYFDFVQECKLFLERFGKTINEQELKNSVKDFLRTSFYVDQFCIIFKLYPLPSTSALFMYAPQPPSNESVHKNIHRTTSLIEEFLYTATGLHLLKKQAVYVYDELAFDNFYEPTVQRSAFLSFMHTTGIDVFIPIYIKEKLIAYIAIEHHQRALGKKLFYTDIECSQLLLFTKYLTNLIIFTQHQSINALIQKDAELHQELENKQQEVAHYQSKLHAFVQFKQNHIQNFIGVLYYKNYTFSFGNGMAQELIDFELNTPPQCILSRDLKQITSKAAVAGITQSLISNTLNGIPLIVTAIPCSNNTLIMVTLTPQNLNFAKNQLLLQKASDWDYQLYLETTKQGALINQLLANTSEPWLAFKIKLLKIALSHTPVLLENIPTPDLPAIIDLLHTISMQRSLHIISLTAPVTDTTISIELFGLSSVLSSHSTQQSIIEKLNNKGTLFIHNVHYLPAQVQHLLTELIHTGSYHVFKDSQRISADIRIIASIDKPIHEILQENPSAAPLINALRHTSIALPSPLTQPESTIVSAYGRRNTPQSFKNFLLLNDIEKNSTTMQRPHSFLELTRRIEILLKNKGYKPPSSHKNISMY